MLENMYTGRWRNDSFYINYKILNDWPCSNKISLTDIEVIVRDNPNQVSIWDLHTVEQLYVDRPDLVELLLEDIERRFKSTWWPTLRLAYRVTRTLPICTRLHILHLTRDWWHHVPWWGVWAIRTRQLSRREWRKWLRSIPGNYKEL